MKLDKKFILGFILGMAGFQAVLFAAVNVSAEFDPLNKEDRAGVWNQFHTGRGNIHRGTADWAFKLKLNLPQTMQIRSITILHNRPGEGWSTSSENFFNKTLYPIVVFYQGAQINTTYNQSLGMYPSGEHVFQLYAQKESMPFVGAKFFIEFEDGSLIKTSVASAGFGPESMPTCSEEVTFDAGREWAVQEGIWAGHWVRRGDSNFFNASWAVPNDEKLGDYAGKTAADEVELVNVDGYQVHLLRKGTKGYYHGVLSCDKKSITKGIGDWFADGDHWSAVISSEKTPAAQ